MNGSILTEERTERVGRSHVIRDLYSLLFSTPEGKAEIAAWKVKMKDAKLQEQAPKDEVVVSRVRS